MFRKKTYLPPEAPYKEVWSKGDIFAKLSFFVMGLFQLKNKHWLKGLLLLASEVIIIGWLLFSGFKAISMLGTLGTVKTKKLFGMLLREFIILFYLIIPFSTFYLEFLR